MWILMKLFMHVICIDYACNMDASILDDKIQSISHGWTLNAIVDQISLYEIKKSTSIKTAYHTFKSTFNSSFQNYVILWSILAVDNSTESIIFLTNFNNSVNKVIFFIFKTFVVILSIVAYASAAFFLCYAREGYPHSAPRTPQQPAIFTTVNTKHRFEFWTSIQCTRNNVQSARNCFFLQDRQQSITYLNTNL